MTKSKKIVDSVRSHIFVETALHTVESAINARDKIILQVDVLLKE